MPQCPMPGKSAKSNRSKHQHWVPQFYLRYFATPESRDTRQPQVWIFSKDPAFGDETLTNVRNVCGKRYLYSPNQPNGERIWDLDERLDDLESSLGAVWPMLAAAHAPLQDEALRKGLALFIAVMHLRNPNVRSQVETIHRRLVQMFESGPRLPDGTPDVTSVEIDGQLHELNLSDWRDYRAWGKDDHDRFFTHIVQAEARHIAQLLLRKRWSVVCADEDTFITTDKPVSLQHLTSDRFGFGTKDAIVTFPLSPRRLLVMDDLHDEPANQYYPLKTASAGAFNFTVWRGASRFMVTGRPVCDVLREICSVAENIDRST